MTIKGSPVHPTPRPRPHCVVRYKGVQYAFFAVDDTYCSSPLTGELLLRHQLREQYVMHIKQILAQYPHLKPAK